MTETEYKSLAEFERLPLRDESPFSSEVDDPREDQHPGRWCAVHEALDLKTARRFLQQKNFVPKGGIRFWDGEKKKSDIFAYFWEKRD